MFELPTAGPPRRLASLALPPGLTVLVLAPHPDDFDAIAVTLRWLHEGGHRLHLAVLTTGASGVEDGYEGACTAEAKAALREAEQIASCRHFGLPASRIAFLRLWGEAGSDADGPHALDAGPADLATLRAHLLALRPALVFMPHGNDSNRTHRRTFESFRTIALEERLALTACLNLDAKTAQMRCDLVADFDDEAAAWKAGLLRLHRSQHARNLRTRGLGFDERVLGLNRDAAARLGSPMPYAEVFELLRYGA